jgi:hypothetical protein
MCFRLHIDINTTLCIAQIDAIEENSANTKFNVFCITHEKLPFAKR